MKHPINNPMKYPINKTLLGLAILAVSSAALHAAPLTLINPGFEFDTSGVAYTADVQQYNGDTDPDGIFVRGIQGFTFVGGASDIGGDVGIQPFSGATDLDGNGYFGGVYLSNRFIEQITPFTLQEGTYTLSLGTTVDNPNVELFAFDSGTSTYRSLGAGNNSIVVSVGSPTSELIAFRLGSEDVFYRNFDNVSLDFVAIPEPSTIALLALSGFGIVMFARRRRVS